MLNVNPIPNNSNQPIVNPMFGAVPITGFDPAGYLPQPVQNPQVTNAQNAQPINTQTLYNIAMNSIGTQPQLKDEWSPINTGNTTADYFLNLIPNAMHDIPEIATGAVSMLAHPIKNVVNPVAQWATETAPYQSFGENLGDIVNTLGAKAAGLDVKKQAEATKKLLEGDTEGFKRIGNELRGEFIDNLRKNPLIVSSILAPNVTASVAGKAVRGTGQAVENLSKGKVAWGAAGKQAGNISNLAIAEVSKEMRPIRVAAQDMVAEAKKVGGDTKGNIAQVLDAWEIGREVPENLKGVEKAWIKLQEEQLKVLPPEGLESAKSLAMNQYQARKKGITYNEAEREFLPLEELLYEGIDIGNPIELEARLAGLRKDFTRKKRDSLVTDLTAEEKSKLLNNITEDEYNIAVASGSTIRDIEKALGEDLGKIRKNKGLNLTEAEKAIYKDNLNKISEMAANGDRIAADFLEANSRYETGLMKPVLHAGVRDVELLGTLGAEELAGRRLAGKASSREYGTATPEQIAKAYADSLDETIMNIAESKLDRHVSESVLRGEFPDGTPLTDINSKELKYIDSALLQDGRLQSALRTAKDSAFEGAIPIDLNYYNALRNQFGRVENTPFTGAFKDGYGLLKDAVLNSGFYLGGNALSGAANAVINSNIGIFDDMLNAAKTKGELARKLGAYREIGADTRKFKYDLSQKAHALNRAVGGKVISAADAFMQDMFSEIAAHANLRSKGIKAANRLNAIDNMAPVKLAEVINDVKNVALLNSVRRVIPEGATAVTGLNPFFNWQVTAAQSSFHTLMNHPLISQIIAANFFGTIGFDKEMQNRLNLGVKSDRQLVSYRVDQKTGDAKEINMDFLPQLTFTKAIMEPASLARTVPLIGDLINAAQGKDAYGKPFKRTHSGTLDGTVIQGDTRYRRNPQTGQIEKVEGQLDEFISTLIKDTSGVPNLVNKTVGPTAAALANLVTGSDRYRFYQPYGQSIFGSFSTGQADVPTSLFSSGNPLRGRAGEETLRSILNQYEQTYYPENRARMNRAYTKGMGSLIRRENKALNQLGE